MQSPDDFSSNFTLRPPLQRRGKFTLGSLFGLMLLVAVSFVVCRLFGVRGANLIGAWFLTLPILIGLVLLWFGRRFAWLWIAFGYLSVLLIPPALIDATRHVHSRDMWCGSNLRNIALALHAYEMQYRTFPPAYVLGPDGKPWHSWRVLILPYIDEDVLYRQYNFNEPWNGPNNSRLAAKMPPIYVCPGNLPPPGTFNTNYLAVVGPHTAWPGATSRKLDDFPDGIDETLLLVETINSGICWMQPADLDVATLPRHIGAPGGIASAHPSVVNIALASSRLLRLPQQANPKVIPALLTADGGEQVDLPD